jgi:hypothetical protein
LPSPSIPIITHSSIRVSLLETNQSVQIAEDDTWDAMEKDLVEDGYNRNPVVGKKLNVISKTGSDGGKTICAVGGNASVKS